MRPTAAPSASLLPLLVCVAVAGCRLPGLTLPAGADLAGDGEARPRAAARTIPLELLFVRCDEHDAALQEELWTFVDEQSLDPAARRGLNANGLRVGIVDGHLPAHLAERFLSPATDAVAGDGLAAPAVTRRLLRLLPGAPSEVVAATRLPQLVLLEQSDGEISGATYHDASPQVTVRAWPADDGRVRLEIVPEVKHGPVEKSWVGEDGMFRLETGQRRHRMEHLRIDTTLPAHAMLLVACAGSDAASVGDAMLRDRDRDAGTSVRLLAIRPLAGGVDPMFDGEHGAPDGGNEADGAAAGP